jgi:DNA polymerase III sliding clamp (beta) subunit (PCNA family)
MKIEDLLRGIKFVMPAVDNNQLITENADLIVFEKDRLWTFNGALMMQYPIETELECGVRAKPLYDILSRIRTGNVRLTIEEEKNGQFFLKGPGKKLKLPIITHESQIPFNEGDLQFEKLPEGFTEGLSLCVHSASKDVTIGVMQGIYVAKNEMLSTDNYRIANYQMKGDVESDFIISRDHAEIILKSVNITDISLDKSWVHFMGINNERVSCRLMNGEYKIKRLKEILDVKEDGQYEFPEGLADLINRAGVFSSQDSAQIWYVRLYREKDQLVVEGKSEDGEYEERLAWQSEFPEGMVLEMEPAFVLKILGITKQFILANGGKFAVFTKGKEFRHLEMVLRGE